MTITGTCYFPTLAKACAYYRNQNIWRGAVLRKINDGEIHIGEPAVEEGERVILIDNGTRYGIESAE